MNTPTPRTDAAQFIRHDMTAAVDADFARTLERELAKERARLDWLAQNWVNWPLGNVVDTIRAAIDAARKEAQP